MLQAITLGFPKGDERVSSQPRYGMSEEDLVVYYSAAKISPNPEDPAFKEIEDVHNFISSNLMDAVFDPQNPDVSSEKRETIIVRALWIARGNWETYLSWRGQTLPGMIFTRSAIADLDKRLGDVSVNS